MVGDKSYSELSKNIPRMLVNHPKFESILKDVSTYQLPQGMEQGSYQLKPSCWLEFDRYFLRAYFRLEVFICYFFHFYFSKEASITLYQKGN